MTKLRISARNALEDGDWERLKGIEQAIEIINGDAVYVGPRRDTD